MAIRQLNIERRTYYFYDDLVNIKDFKSNNLKLDKEGVLGNEKNLGIIFFTICKS